MQQGKLVKQAARFKAQASKLNHPDTFASCAKLQRQAAACEKEANIISNKQAGPEPQHAHKQQASSNCF